MRISDWSSDVCSSDLPPDLTRENVLAFDALLRDAERPVLVHCASGNRVGAMAALRAAWVEGRSAEEAIAMGRDWGLKGLEEEVRRRAEENTSELQSIKCISSAVFCLKKKITTQDNIT